MDYSKILLIVDMDGTLLSSSGEKAFISKTNQLIIQDFIEKGGTFSIASGRNLQNTFNVIPDIKSNFPASLINGALIYERESRKILKAYKVDQAFIKDAIDYYDQNDDVVLVVADEYKMYNLKPKRSDYSHRGFKWSEVSKKELKSINVLKVAFVFDPQDGNRIMNEIKQLPNVKSVNLSPSSPFFIEAVDQSVSKGNAIKESIKDLKLEDKTLICVGDYLNDESMLELADYAYVPKNGHDKLKSKFKSLSVTNDEDIMTEIIKEIDKL